MAAENAANSHKDRYTSLVMQARLCSTSSFRERMSQNTKTSLFEKCFPARRWGSMRMNHEPIHRTG